MNMIEMTLMFSILHLESVISQCLGAYNTVVDTCNISLQTVATFDDLCDTEIRLDSP